MAEALATFSVEEILKKLICLAAEDISLAWGFKQDIKKLRDSLVFVQALLQDAGEKQTENKSIQSWLQTVQHLAYDAEDLLDEFGYELLRRKIEVRTPLKKVCNFFSSSNPVMFRLKMAHEIKNINKSLEKIRNESNGLGLVHVRYVENIIQETDSFHDNSKVVGRNDEISSILNIIAQNSSNIFVIPIVGMPGLGKTTMAKMLRKEVREKKMFDETIWVCVSNTFDERVILGGMLESLDKTTGGIHNVDALLKHLRENLENKSFFLVLDDVWNEEPNQWDSLMNRLLKVNENKRNCIVVTTRSEQVASITETFSMRRHYPMNLSDDECWSIIKEKVIGKSFDEEVPQDLEVLGRDIARKCRGLPLLAKVLGGTMRLKKTSHYWLSIRDSPVWSTLIVNNNIMPILKLSFDRLPSSSLKQCFAYCALFPKDSEIKKAKLIRLWIAQGYVHPDLENNMTIEDIGEQYFNTLLANSLFQDVKKDKLGNIKSCKMHDSVHVLAEFVSRTEIWTSNSVLKNKDSNIQHVSLNSTGDIPTKLEEVGCQKLRSLLWATKVYNNNMKGFKRMRVLHIDYFDTTGLSTSIVRLKHLRYLDISGNVIPRSISKLYNLQTLKLTDCVVSEKLSGGIKNLVKLKHLIFNNADLTLTPSNIGKLTCLQTLSIFAVGTTKGHQIEELGSLKQLNGKLRICNLENVKGKLNAYEADIKGKIKLRGLTYEWSYTNGQVGNNADDVLEGLEPPPNLLKLKIRNFKGQIFSTWLSDHQVLRCLRRLELYNCRECIQLPTLGLMPCLEYLEMKGFENAKCIAREFYTNIAQTSGTNGGKQKIVVFPSLIELVMEGMSILEEWVIPTEDGMSFFPSLESVTIYRCPMLKNVPVSEIVSLKNVYISNCPQLTDFGNTSTPFANVETLYINNCHEVTTIPEIGSLSIKKLNVERCFNLSSLCVSHVSSLEHLIINDCGRLSELKEMNDLRSLLSLSIKNCGIGLLPRGLEFSRSLQYFKIFALPNLTVVPQYIGDLTCLVEFEITNCDMLVNIPARLQSSKSLKKLRILYCQNLENIPENLEELSFLENLAISMCSSLIRVPRSFPNSDVRLKSLEIGGFSSELEEFPNIHSMVSSSVEDITLIGWGRLKCIPYLQFQNFTSVKTLSIVSFDGVEVLPEWLGNLVSLGILGVHGCNSLRSLPESMTNLTKLHYLHIDGCPVLAAKLSNVDDTESSKVSHIQKVSIIPPKFRR